MPPRGGFVALLSLLLVLTLGAVGTAAAAPPEDPETDVIGWERGVWHNESIEVDQRDGFTERELDAFIARASARLEVLREREFTAPVPVEVIDRDEFGNQTNRNTSREFREWNNQVWESLFIVGETEDVQDILHATSTAQTSGAYYFESNEIRIVTDSPGNPRIDRGTLVHELVHAQQDQHVDLTNASAVQRSQDEELAFQSVIEGEANYLEAKYEARCVSEWECVAPVDSGGGTGPADLNLGVYLVLIHPYSDGPPYVQYQKRDGGWRAVDAAFERPPDSTEQVIHRTGERPAPLTVRNNATGEWRAYPGQGQNGTDRAGEASIFSMLWYQAREYQADTVDVSGLVATSDPYDIYDYDAPPSAGWANDAILPVRKETTTGTAFGYTWVTAWDTRADAEEFEAAYLAVLAAHDAQSVGPNTWVIVDGPFADAFRVVRTGRRVTVVNAPDVAALGEIRPGLAPAEPLPTPAATPPTSSPTSPTGPSTPIGEPTRPVEQPGFGLLAAVGAVLIALFAAQRRD